MSRPADGGLRLARQTDAIARVFARRTLEVIGQEWEQALGRLKAFVEGQ